MNKLTNSFLSIDFDNKESFINDYNIMTISYFDHYLTVDEYSEADLVSYSDVKGNLEKEKKFEDIADKFIKLYEALYYLSDERVTVYFEGNSYHPKSYEEYKLFIMNAMKEKPLCELLYPSLMMFSVTGYDLTHSLFFLKDNNELILTQKKIKNLVSSIGLNII